MPDLPWNPQQLDQSPFYHSLLPARHTWMRQFAHWPEVADYAAMMELSTTPPLSGAGRPIVMVEQTDKPDWSRFEEVYEPRIYLRGELQTRRHNWHDFFNGMIWATFPQAKSLINSIHYHWMLQQWEAGLDNRHRTPTRDYLTQLDESGVVILSRAPDLLDLIRNFRWKELFWERREEMLADLKIIVFGHALLEHATQPFIGMTGRGLLLDVGNDFFALPPQAQLAAADSHISEHLRHSDRIDSPRKLSPFPLLGYPGWHPGNALPQFYDNTDYFRPGRRQLG